MMDMTPSTTKRFRRRPRRTSYCHISGCNHFTYEGKSFCSVHVEQHEYVQHLLSILSDRATEEDNVNKKGWRAVDIQGSIAKEIILLLRVHGERTIARIARDFRRSIYIQTQYIEALRHAKMVSTRENKRGGIIARVI